ncbi:hypothetical protein CASFOL_020111 [Castilleja foliolosa]|uniref:Peptidase S24/S26A/S26B/S26C domain-containing protein n=1 Tax=Castilleja foliolosa TaxID=1961234 RepID=A0ABD3D179_9LAMI
MDELSRPRRSAGREIIPLNKPDSKPTRGGIQSDAAAGGATADDEDVQEVSRAGADQSRQHQLMVAVHGPSMLPTLNFSGDVLLVEKLSHRLGRVGPGDVVLGMKSN